MHALESVFGTEMHVAWWQECLRAPVVFGYGLVLLRLTGRRTFGRWSALDIVVSIVLGSSLSRAVTGNAPFGGTLAAMGLLMLLHWLLGQAVARSASASRVLEGTPVELAKGGRPRRSEMLRESVSDADLQESLRGSGIETLAEARLVVLEPSGRINVLKHG
jgi:uncharacterized membrane protein YcaP (DUF421 family)